MAEEQQGGGAFGAYVRAQRRVAQLSLRQLSELTHISNPYLSQIERGLHQPSITVIKNLARALGVSVEALLAQAAGVGRQDPAATGATEAAIGADPHLDDAQKAALLAVYHSMVGGPVEPQGTPPAPVAKAAAKRAPAKKAPAERAPASKAPGKRAPASKAPGKRAPAKKAPTKRSAPVAS